LGFAGVDDFKIVTKLPSLPQGEGDVFSWVYRQMQDSLQRLNVGSVYGLLIHNSQQLAGSRGKGLIRAICRLKAEGVVQKIGVSIYAPTELDSIMRIFPVDLVQAPFNVFDRRLHSSGWLRRLHDSGVEVHVRSVFLQGLLLMPVAAIPEKFKRWQPLFSSWHGWLIENKISPIHSCIWFVQSYPQIARIVVGVESMAQLKQLIDAARNPSKSGWPKINCPDEDIINPSRWAGL
jgi:aryl-alcohol dehydrogenase-like predicted oxidoreductase